MSSQPSGIYKCTQTTGNYLVWNGAGYIFFNRILPFGLCSAPYIFNMLSDALEWILIDKLGVANLFSFLKFLGISLDSVNMLALLPPDQLSQARTLLARWRKRSSCKLKELQSRIGILQFPCRFITPGAHIFTTSDWQFVYHSSDPCISYDVFLDKFKSSYD